MKFGKCPFVFDEDLFSENLLWRYSVAPDTLLQGCCAGFYGLCPQGNCFEWKSILCSTYQYEDLMCNCVPLERKCPFLILTNCFMMQYDLQFWSCWSNCNQLSSVPSILIVGSVKRASWSWAWCSKSFLYVTFASPCSVEPEFSLRL